MSEGVLQQQYVKRRAAPNPPYAPVCPILCCGVSPCCSHNYRCPEAFAGQTVVVVGASNSGAAVLGVCVKLHTGTAFTNPCTRHARHTPHTTTSSAERTGLLASCCAAGLTGLLYHSALLCCAARAVVLYRTCLCAGLTGLCWLSPSPAGEDVFRQVAAVADQVIVAARSWREPEWAADAENPRPFGPRGNITRRGMVSALHPDGRVEFSKVRRAVGDNYPNTAALILASFLHGLACRAGTSFDCCIACSCHATRLTVVGPKQRALRQPS